MTTAIQEYSPTEAALADLRQRYKDVVFDVATTAGMATARKGRAEIRGLRTALESKRVEIKAPALERCRLIDAEAKRITAELLALETPIDDLIKSEETRKERERAEKERIERERVEAIQSRIAKIGAYSASLAGQPSTAIAAAQEKLAQATVDDWAQEFAEQAREALSAASTTLAELHVAAVAQEAEQARVKAEREELARLRAEQEQRAREEQARIAEETRKRAEAEAESRAKIETEQRAARERIEADERQARLAREEADRVARVAREAEEARIKAERERIEAERRAVEDRERKAREAEEATKREAARLQNELLDARTMLATFRQRFGHRKEFAKVVTAINAVLQKDTTEETA